MNALDRFRSPDVLADRHADPDAAKGDRPRRRPGAEHALLVKHPVIRQIDLEANRLDAAPRNQRRRVVELATFHPWRANQDRRTAVAGVLRKGLHRRAAGLLKGRLQHKVFGRVAGNIELRSEQDVGAEAGGLGPRFAQARQIAGDIADNGRYLGERDDQALRHGRLVTRA